jgi:hypothetical protein
MILNDGYEFDVIPGPKIIRTAPTDSYRGREGPRPPPLLMKSTPPFECAQ